MTLRIAFVGSCQVTGLRAAAMALLPDARISSHHVGVTGSAEDIRAAIEGADAVVTGIGERRRQDAQLGVAALEGSVGRALFLPNFVFTGLHPDMIYLSDGARAVPGPISDYHSALVAAVFTMGIPRAGVARLFNAHVFARAGYLDGYAAARAATIAAFGERGYDLGPGFDDWEARGEPFTYTINHPAIVVMAHLATLALRRLGLIDPATPPPEGVHDALAQAVIAPVHPWVARRAGIMARPHFMAAAAAGTDPATRVITIEEYIDRSWAIYRALDRRLLETPAVTAAATALSACRATARYPAPVRSFASAEAM